MIRIGTRGSNLALAQTIIVKDKLLKVLGCHENQISIIPIHTTGDRIKNKNLYEIGGKGLFIKELEEALLNKEIDLAVHSLKDIPAIIPSKLKIAAIVERANPFDAFLSPIATRLIDLPKAAVVGTSSPRRAAQILYLRPDVKIIPFRGNVDTRIKKLHDKVADATVLSAAGLERLGFDQSQYNVISCDEMVPAIGQGAICVECRESDNDILQTLTKIADNTAYKLASCERIFLEGLNANCKTPIGGYASLEGKRIKFTGVVAKFNGSVVLRATSEGNINEYEKIGKEVLEKIKPSITTDFFES